MIQTRMLLATALCTTGCSWLFMTKPPHVVAAPNAPVDCTTSRAAPVLDTICSSYFVVNGIYLIAVKDCADAFAGETCASSGTKAGGAVLSGALALVCGLSAASGYGDAGRCEKIKDDNALCIAGDVNACRVLRPGWMPPDRRPPPAAAPPPAPSEPVPGCSKDTDCKGNRICERGACVEPKQ